jgi:hypothetical protein
MKNTQTSARVPEGEASDSNVSELVHRCGNELVEVRRVAWLAYKRLQSVDETLKSLNETMDIFAGQKKREITAKEDAMKSATA